MGGFFGVASKTDCVSDIYFGTDYHSHLGTKRGGLAVTNPAGRIDRRIHDISNAQFRSKFDGEIALFSGNTGFGIISDTEDQPLVISSQLGTFAIVTVGKINNVDEILDLAFASGCSHLSESSNGEPNPTEVVAMLISRSNSMVAGIEYAQKVIDGSCSILVLSGNRIYAARDRYGRTPVILGRKPGSYAVTMETTAFPTLDYELFRELGPGEIVEITADGVCQLRAPGRAMKMCSFFWVYYGYPSSSYEGVNTESARYRNGEDMAEQDKDILENIDTVSGIPDSGIAHAVGYANRSGIHFARPFIKYTPTWSRSFTPTNQEVRNQVAKMKQIPVPELIDGKKLLLLDDSIVRGTQLRETVDFLYGSGAKEVHMRSACPPIMYSCKYLNFSRSKSDMELLTRKTIQQMEGDAGQTHLDEYADFRTERGQCMLKKICEEMGFDSLGYQSIDGMLEAIGLDRKQVCTYCWTGEE